MEHFYRDQVKTLFFNAMPVRTVNDCKGKTWWAARDLCDILRVDNMAMVMGYIGRDKKNVFTIKDDKAPDLTLEVVGTMGLYAFFLHSPICPAGTKNFKLWLIRKAVPEVEKDKKAVSLKSYRQKRMF